MLRQVIYSALILVSLSACSPHPNLSKPPVEREVVLKCVGNRYSKPSTEYFDSQCEKRRFEFEAFVYVDRPYGTVVLGPDLNLSADWMKYNYRSILDVIEAEFDEEAPIFLRQLDKVIVSGVIGGPSYSPEVLIKNAESVSLTAEELARQVKIKGDLIGLPRTLEQFAAMQYMDALEEDASDYTYFVDTQMSELSAKSSSVSVNENFTSNSALYTYTLLDGGTLRCEKGLRGGRMFLECKE